MGAIHSQPTTFYDLDSLYRTPDSENGLEKVGSYFLNGLQLGAIFGMMAAFGYGNVHNKPVSMKIFRFGTVTGNVVLMAMLLPTTVVLSSHIRGNKNDNWNHFWGGMAMLTPLYFTYGAHLTFSSSIVSGLICALVKDYKDDNNCAGVWYFDYHRLAKRGEYHLMNHKYWIPPVFDRGSKGYPEPKDY